MTITEASMILRSVQAVVGFPNTAQPNRLLKNQLSALREASNMEIYGLLDLAVDINLNASEQGTGLLDDDALMIVSEMSKSINLLSTLYSVGTNIEVNATERLFQSARS